MACVVACQDQNDFYGCEVALREVTHYEGGTIPLAFLSFFSLSCFHCADAPCLRVCPSGAIFRKDPQGVVLVDRDLCVGCHSCEMACPFGAPKFAEDGKMAKCDFCHERMENGLKPACVLACPAGALDVGPVEDLNKKKAKKASMKFLTTL